MEKNINYLLFNSVDSIHDYAYKFHRLKDKFYISIKSIERSIGYEPKLFPGDDRSEVVIRQKKEIYFIINNKILENKLIKNIKIKDKIVFMYKSINEINTNLLIDFFILENENQLINLNYNVFPKIIKNDFIFKSEELNSDDFC
jgi:hypothetical protein